MAALSLLAIFPASRLPNCRPGEIRAKPQLPGVKREEARAGE
ncbi:MAG: hypothetical protein FAZ92_01627 [Accumulibacter sp.]|jgi:hypothetical protein|nr:hypothetical protein [Accumulibacter sp.]TLD46186.1 MAG: hypothetical protein FAZ92_01627 [Accumulibacter sp.]